MFERSWRNASEITSKKSPSNGIESASLPLPTNCQQINRFSESSDFSSPPEPRNRKRGSNFPPTLPSINRKRPTQPQPNRNRHQTTGRKSEAAAHPPDHERVGGALDGEVHHTGDAPEQPPPGAPVPRPVPPPQLLQVHPLVRHRALQRQRRRQQRNRRRHGRPGHEERRHRDGRGNGHRHLRRPHRGRQPQRGWADVGGPDTRRGEKGASTARRGGCALWP